MGPCHEFAEILSKTTDIPADRSMPGPYIGIIIKPQSFKSYNPLRVLFCNNDADLSKTGLRHCYSITLSSTT